MNLRTLAFTAALGLTLAATPSIAQAANVNFNVNLPNEDCPSNSVVIDDNSTVLQAIAETNVELLLRPECDLVVVTGVKYLGEDVPPSANVNAFFIGLNNVDVFGTVAVP